MALGSTQPLAEMSARNLPEGKGRLAYKADKLTASVNRLCRKCGSIDVSQPYGPSRLVNKDSFALLLHMRLQSGRMDSSVHDAGTRVSLHIDIAVRDF
jgi:hypothetical protein